jgi:hypothetical protein
MGTMLVGPQFVAPKYIDEMARMWFERVITMKDVKERGEDMLIEDRQGTFNLPKLDPDTPRVEYENNPELENAPESVKKIFSLGFGTRTDEKNSWENAMLKAALPPDTVSVPGFPDNSLIRKVVKLTLEIREKRQLLDLIWKSRSMRPKWIKNALAKRLEARRVLLDMLRAQNRTSFDRLCQALRIAYFVPRPEDEEPLQTRRGWIEHQARAKVEAIKEGKMREYHAKLVAGQAEFSALRERRLAELDAEEAQIREAMTGIEGRRARVPLDGPVAGRYSGSVVDTVSERLIFSRFFEHRLSDEYRRRVRPEDPKQ